MMFTKTARDGASNGQTKNSVADHRRIPRPLMYSNPAAKSWNGDRLIVPTQEPAESAKRAPMDMFFSTKSRRSPDVSDKNKNINHSLSMRRVYEVLGYGVIDLRDITGSDGSRLRRMPNTYTELGSFDKPELYFKRIGRGFVLDALLGAWDSIGNNGNNIFIREDGQPIRSGFLCGFNRRTCGKPKNMFWRSEVLELHTLRDSTINPASANVFAHISQDDIAHQVRFLGDHTDILLAAVPQEHRRMVHVRLEWLIDYIKENNSNIIESRIKEKPSNLFQRVKKSDSSYEMIPFLTAPALKRDAVGSSASTATASLFSTVKEKGRQRVSVRSWPIADRLIEEPALMRVRGKWCSAGALLVEPDASIWLYKPKNHFGGYEWSFPKGRIEDNLSPQQTAHREVLEETGLEMEIFEYGADQERGASTTRYYLARRTGGDPTAFLPDETSDVRNMSLLQALSALNVARDRKVLAEMVSSPDFELMLNEIGRSKLKNFKQAHFKAETIWRSGSRPSAYELRADSPSNRLSGSFDLLDLKIPGAYPASSN